MSNSLGRSFQRARSEETLAHRLNTAGAERLRPSRFAEKSRAGVGAQAGSAERGAAMGRGMTLRLLSMFAVWWLVLVCTSGLFTDKGAGFAGGHLHAGVTEAHGANASLRSTKGCISTMALLR